MKSDTAIVRELAERIRRAKRQGPSAMRRPGRKSYGWKGSGGVGAGRDTFTFHEVVRALDLNWWDVESRADARRLLKRAMKKSAQPHRRNHNRRRMRRRAAGKRDVTRRRSLSPPSRAV